MQHGLAISYYNPYYLLHYFTGQKLIRSHEWEEIFSRVGLKCIKKLTTDTNIDSTGFEIGYLLKKGNF